MFGKKKDSQGAQVAELEAKLAAIHRSQAVIEFDLDGTVLSANENFLHAMGYSADEVIGRNHAQFVDPEYARSAEYKEAWAKLNRGEFIAGKFPRYGKGGREVWLRATYNPLLDARGKPYKVIKYAIDVTDSEIERRRLQKERDEEHARQELAITRLADGLNALSAGDLTYRISGDFPSEYARLQTDFNATAQALTEALRAIVGASRSIGSSTGEISRAADDLSRRTEQQAASLEETAAALDELTATVRRAADGAKQASAVIAKSRDEAEASGQVVRQAVAAMGEIERSSSQISQIIGVIDEIAFQTNLLALNAGVEAARAGDAGKGFAVVASEVRALAQRSADAAKEIKTLISASTEQVGSGVSLVGDAGKALERIVGQVGEINVLVSEIAASSQEQATGLDEVNRAVNQMDQVTQQNAAMVEESTAASQAVAQEAHELGALVARFRIGAEASGFTAPQTPPSRQTIERSDARGRMAELRRAIGGGGRAQTQNWEQF